MSFCFWPAHFVASLLVLLLLADPASAALTIFGNAPRIEVRGPGNSYELGTVFQSSVSGQITGLRFYMGPVETSNPGGLIKGTLWANDGTVLASVEFTNPTEGWNEALLAAPVTIAAATPYVVSVNNHLNSSGQNWSTNEHALFAFSPIVNGPLMAQAGTYAIPAGTFPTAIFPSTGGGSFYGRDVIFEATAQAAVPEPASLALWSVLAIGGIAAARRKPVGQA